MQKENPFQQYLDDNKLRQSYISRTYHIPKRTVAGWYLGERKCNDYILLMIAELEKHKKKSKKR